MSIPTYRTGFPQDGSSLGSTKAQIRANLDGTFATLGVDHINNNGAPGSGTPGYHNVIHFQDKGSSAPGNVANVTQVYTNTIQSAQQIMLKSTGNNVYQMTNMIDGSFASFAENPGWTWLPGGLLLQWGFVSADLEVTNHGNVTTPVTYTTSMYNVFVLPFYTGSAPNGGCPMTAKITSNNGFTWQAYTNSGSYNGLYWWTIGF